MQFLGRYEVLGEIASGGMGKVYLARVLGEGGFEREVALKVMHPHLVQDPDFVAMFLDEARLAARIRHPNVVPTLDVQKSADGLFLVMDFVEGLSLSAMIKRLRKAHQTAEGDLVWDPDSGAISEDAERAPARLPLAIAIRIILDTLHGLHAAHELKDRDGTALNIVHRDVSPANVLVGVDGVARITDFGIARAEARLSSTKGGQIKGKIPYMPPEQIMADRVDRRADVYAASVVLWEMLVGRRLFKAGNEGALLQMVLKGVHTGPQKENPMVPDGVNAACLRALSLDTSERFATAADFADALEQTCHEASIRWANPRQVAKFVHRFESNADRVPARKSVPGSWPSAVTPGSTADHVATDAAVLDSSPSALRSGSLPTGHSGGEGLSSGTMPSRLAPSPLQSDSPPTRWSDGAEGVEAAPPSSRDAGSVTRAAAVLVPEAATDGKRSSRWLGPAMGVLGVVAGSVVAAVVLKGTLGADSAPAAAAPTEQAAPTDTSDLAVTASATPTATPATSASVEVEADAGAEAADTAEPEAKRPPRSGRGTGRRPPKKSSGGKAAGTSAPKDVLPSDFLPPEL